MNNMPTNIKDAFPSVVFLALLVAILVCTHTLESAGDRMAAPAGLPGAFAALPAEQGSDFSKAGLSPTAAGNVWQLAPIRRAHESSAASARHSGPTSDEPFDENALRFRRVTDFAAGSTASRELIPALYIVTPASKWGDAGAGAAGQSEQTYSF